MAKNKKKSKPNHIFMFVVMPLLAIGISSLAVYRGVEDYIATSHYFTISEVKAFGLEDMRYLALIKDELIGVNIFQVNTKSLADRIQRKFPTFYSVVVIRVLPSQISITAKERRPVALLKREAYYLLDADGVVLGEYPLNTALNFPIIAGFENKLPSVKVGVNYASILEHPLFAARVLRARHNEIEESFPKDSRMAITSIMADNPGNMVFTLGQTLQIMVNEKTISDKILLLPYIIRTIGGDIVAVKYIDLRPKEPVIAMNDKKKSSKKI
jgi:hypothetical protein